jgi:hypothetical protein
MKSGGKLSQDIRSRDIPSRISWDSEPESTKQRRLKSSVCLLRPEWRGSAVGIRSKWTGVGEGTINQRSPLFGWKMIEIHHSIRDQGSREILHLDLKMDIPEVCIITGKSRGLSFTQTVKMW